MSNKRERLEDCEYCIFSIKKIIDRSANINQAIQQAYGQSLLNALISDLLSNKDYVNYVNHSFVWQKNKIYELIKFLVFNKADLETEARNSYNAIKNAEKFDEYNKANPKIIKENPRLTFFEPLLPIILECKREVDFIHANATKIIHDNTGIIVPVSNIISGYLK